MKIPSLNLLNFQPVLQKSFAGVLQKTSDADFYRPGSLSMPAPYPVRHSERHHTSGIFDWKVPLFATIIGPSFHLLITKEDYYARV